MRETLDGAEVRRHLQTVLDSSAFRGSKRSCSFLQFVAEQTLQGNAQSLKERVIAVELFGRDEGAELGEDSIVRGAAREVRRRLALFYGSPEAEGCAMRIQLPTGTYVPEFERAAEEPPPEEPVREETVQALAIPRDRPRMNHWTLAIITLLAGLQVVAALLNVYSAYSLWKAKANERAAREHRPDFEEFWSPYLRAARGGRPILVALPWLAGQTAQMLPPAIPSSGTAPTLKGVRSNKETGLQVSSQIAAFLGRYGATVRVRALAEPGKSPAAANPTIVLAPEPGSVQTRLPMRFVKSGDHFDVLADSGRRWTTKVHTSDGPVVHEDLVLISRLIQTEELIIEGSDGHGAQAAVHVLTVPELFTASLRGSLPVGWEDRNLQLLLHTDVINGSHTLPTVLDSVAWDTEGSASR
jgi:hypothetical protein